MNPSCSSTARLPSAEDTVVETADTNVAIDLSEPVETTVAG